MIFLISEKRYFHFCFFFYSSRENEWGVSCPNRVENGQDTDFQSLLIAQLFLQPAVYIGYWISTQAGRRPIGHTFFVKKFFENANVSPFGLGTPVSRAVYTRVRSSDRSTSCMRV